MLHSRTLHQRGQRAGHAATKVVLRRSTTKATVVGMLVQVQEQGRVVTEVDFREEKVMYDYREIISQVWVCDN